MIAVLFLRPELWPLVLLVPLAASLFWRLDRTRARRRVRLFGPRTEALGVEPRRPALRRWLTVTALGLACVAALDPAWGEGDESRAHRGVDILVCLDVSRSMLARDIAPSRLAAAKREISALAEAASGERLGLVVFAGDARRAVPLTPDRDTFVDLVDRADPLDVDRGGTDLGAALVAALAGLEGATGDHEVVLLLTDGEDHGGRGARVAERCRERGIAVHTVGFGSPRGAKIAIESERGESFLRDRAGNEVVSTMDPTSLRRIAETTGGAFVTAEGDRPLVVLYESRIRPMARKAFASSARRESARRFQWLLLPAALLWLLEPLLGSVRRRSR